MGYIQSKRGFTLIELIAVLVILAIVLAVTIPTVIKYVDDAHDATYLARGRTILTVSQEEVTTLYVNKQLNETTLENVKSVIIDKAKDEMEVHDFVSLEVDGTGKIKYFAFKVEENKYVVYDGERLQVSTEYQPTYVQVGNTLSKTMYNIFTNNDLVKIKEYILRLTGTHLLDSGGANFAPIMNEYFTKQGIDVQNITYQMYYNPNNAKYILSVANSNINDGSKKAGDTVKYVQYIYTDGSLKTIDTIEYDKTVKIVEQYDSSSGKHFYILDCKY